MTEPSAQPFATGLSFLGAAGTVTGSKHLVRTARATVLLDCGLFQGLKALRLRNWAPPPVHPHALDAVVLSHAHLDHSGFLPIMARHGYRGPILCTPGTADLLPVLWRDAARLAEEDAARANRLGTSRHHPALPLFESEDVEIALRLVRPHGWGEAFEAAAGMRVTLHRAGHILGAAIVEAQIETAHGPKRLVYSGDLGRSGRPILRDPEIVPEADVLIVESTYGDRVHRRDADEELARVINETVRRGGSVVVPAFAVGRTQDLVWLLRRLEDQQRIPIVDVFVDTPMGINVTGIYRAHPEDHNLEMAALADARRDPFATRRFHLAHTVDESKAINDAPGSMVIIAGSGMATGGRVLHHLAHRLPDSRHTVLLVGYQADGTRGRALADGAKLLKMYGQFVPVRARIEAIDGLSAHADRAEIMSWLRGFRRPPARTFLVHGEPAAAQALRATIAEELSWRVDVAQDGATVNLDDALAAPEEHA